MFNWNVIVDSGIIVFLVIISFVDVGGLEIVGSFNWEDDMRLTVIFDDIIVDMNNDIAKIRCNSILLINMRCIFD